MGYGSDGGAVPEGSEELGEFSGIATLTADFNAGTIDGCIGCAGNVLFSGVHYDKSTGGASAADPGPPAAGSRRASRQRRGP